MPISMTCPECGETIRVGDDFAGKTIACPKCRAKVAVPDEASDAVSAEPPRPRRRDDGRSPRRDPAPSSNRATIWIVLAVVGVVCLGMCCVGIGLLLPAISKVRESAARMQTLNNMKRCAIAIHGYHDINRQMPDGFGFSKKHGKNVSVWFQILPFVEADSVYQAGVANAVVPSFIAPSDSYLGPSPDGVVNFAANVRVFGAATLGNVNQPGQALAVAGGEMRSGLAAGRIADGTSNTIMMTTRYGQCAGQPTWYAADAVGGCEVGQLPGRGVGGFMGAGSSTTPPSRRGEATAMFQIAPNETECAPQPGLFGHSFGAGGLSVALCDGTVRNISPKMTPATFARALCPADGHALGVDWNVD